MREIKFRAWDNESKTMIHSSDAKNYDVNTGREYFPFVFEIGYKGRRDLEIMQFAGLKDKNGKEIYEGDVIRHHRPYRSTQTHTGDNIPNGSYTEPMEPEIETIIEDVIFENGAFCLSGRRDIVLSWLSHDYDEESFKAAISFRGKDIFDWNDPTDGELAYLLEKYDCKNLDELLSFVSGIEVIGNIYENPELLNQ